MQPYIPQPRRRLNVRAIIMDNNRLLAVRHRTAQGTASPYWALPGGGVDANESLTYALSRELLEETGIAPQIGNLLFIQQFPARRPDSPYAEEIDFFYHVENPQAYHQINLTNTTHGQAELAACEFINPRQVDILPPFLATTDLSAAIQKGYTQFYSYLAD